MDTNQTPQASAAPTREVSLSALVVDEKATDLERQLAFELLHAWKEIDLRTRRADQAERKVSNQATEIRRLKACYDRAIALATSCGARVTKTTSNQASGTKSVCGDCAEYDRESSEREGKEGFCPYWGGDPGHAGPTCDRFVTKVG